MPSIILDAPFYAVAIPAVIALGLSKGGFSGLGAIATPLVALYLSPLSAAALLLPIMVCQDLISLYVYRKDWSPWNLRVLLPGALVGVVLGYVFATHISDAGVRIVSGGIGIAFAMSAWFRRKSTTSHKATAAGGALWGTISGFTSFVVQGGGPAFQAHVLPQRLSKMTFVGTSTIFFFIVNALKTNLGKSLSRSSWPRASFFNPPTLKFSMSTSEVATSRLISANPSGLLISTVTDRLLRLHER